MAAHEELTEAMKDWDAQSKLSRGMRVEQDGEEAGPLSALPEDMRAQNSRQIKQQLQEIEFRQRQLAKLLNLKEQIENRQILQEEEGKVKGKYQLALTSLLRLLEDTK